MFELRESTDPWLGWAKRAASPPDQQSAFGLSSRCRLQVRVIPRFASSARRHTIVPIPFEATSQDSSFAVEVEVPPGVLPGGLSIRHAQCRTETGHMAQEPTPFMTRVCERVFGTGHMLPFPRVAFYVYPIEQDESPQNGASSQFAQ